MNIVRRYWRIALPIIVMIIIWIFSSRIGAVSEADSLAIANFLGLSNSIIRKLAHVCLFAILGLTWAIYMKNRYQDIFPSAGSLAFAIMLVMAYAVIDELHQSYVPGREAMPIDVILDTLAGTAAILFYISIYSFSRSKKTIKK
ncbi:VanZ family protein [Candidatus Saccharibacteria bacterium]|nr:VanZ family protein [Candidatus Saccharibacteria bacterium]